MLLLLPPSEGKSVPAAGDPVDLGRLWGAPLTDHRRRVLDALVAASARPDAATLLGVGPSLAGELVRNAGVAAAPAAPAAAVYSGVLFAAARLDALDADDAARADERVRILSGLWGALRPGDRIPAYRLPIATHLPGVGPLAGSWRPHLRPLLDPAAAEHLVVDARSSSYAAAWPVPPGGPGHVEVAVLREVDGRRSVVTHWAKHTRGVLAGHLVRTPRDATTPQELAGLAEELVGTPLLAGTRLLAVELSPAARGRHRLALVLG